MKNFINKIRRPLISSIFLMVAMFISGNEVYAQQDSTAAVICKDGAATSQTQTGKKYISVWSDY